MHIHVIHADGEAKVWIEPIVELEKSHGLKKPTFMNVLNVTTPSKNHFYWPDLDIDLHLDSFKNPKKYPLASNS